ncbi:hypothetical protein [Streptosporangium sp. NPDC001681]|uniref:hypothetical protein n=1 Tax=Streptosporangium sp. NPDC001681 TaxID=3154395 RepID=UPI003323ADF9
MRRWLALAAATLIASVSAVVPAAAQTGPPDPAQAVKRQLRAQHGVQIAEISRTIFKDTTSTRDRLTSRLQLGPAGPVAVDTSMQSVLDAKSAKAAETNELLADLASPFHMTVVSGYLYISGIYSLPQGKTWSRSVLPRSAVDYASQQTAVNVFDPAALKTLLRGATVKPVSGGFFYQGTLAKPKIYWRLWTDATGLPKRLLTNKRVAGENRLAKIERVDTRYTDWGMPLVVVPPPADEVIDYEDLEDPLGLSVPEPKELINTLR